MSTFIIVFSFLFLQAGPNPKLIYELTGQFSGGQVVNVTLWQFYNSEGQMVLGGYEHKLNQKQTVESSTPESRKVDLNNEEIQKQLRDVGLTSEQIRAIRSGSQNIDSRTQYMIEYEQATELFMTTADSIYDIRVGMESNEVLGFPKSILQWEIHNEIREINSYQCQKATINYFGRKFTAWFTPEIPLNAGPYLFSGLPGTIIELKDDHGVYTYTLLEVKSSKIPEGNEFSKRQNILSHEQAVRKQWDAIQRYLGDMMRTEQRVQRLLSRQLPGMSVSNSQTSTQPLVFNPHEHFLEWIILDDILQE